MCRDRVTTYGIAAVVLRWFAVARSDIENRNREITRLGKHCRIKYQDDALGTGGGMTGCNTYAFLKRY